jgi:hypothetical protein
MERCQAVEASHATVASVTLSHPLLMIIARDNLGLYPYLCRQFAADRDVIEILVDRRLGEPGRRPDAAQAARGSGERRVQAIDDRLRALGWALVHRSVGGIRAEG